MSVIQKFWNLVTSIALSAIEPSSSMNTWAKLGRLAAIVLRPRRERTGSSPPPRRRLHGRGQETVEVVRVALQLAALELPHQRDHGLVRRRGHAQRRAPAGHLAVQVVDLGPAPLH